MNFLAAGGPELLAMIADGLPVGIWVGRALDGELVYANRRFQELTGVAPMPGPRGGRELVEHYRIHTRSGEPYPAERTPFARALHQRSAVMVDDPVVHHPDGRQVNVRVSAQPLFDGAGTITHVMMTLTDITHEVVAERARAESELRLVRAQRLESIGKLAGGIAHDFNNLLATVKVLVSLLRMGEGDALRLERLHQIDQAAGNGMQLTRGLLDFAGLEQQGSRNPTAPSGASRPRPRRHDAVLQPGKGKVLLVEDEPALSRASTRALTHLGYDVLCAMDGESAVELFRALRHEVVAVVLDMILPRMDGQQTFIALREVDPDVRVVVTSGLVREETRRDMLERGVRHFLSKPYDAEELSQALARVARTSEA